MVLESRCWNFTSTSVRYPRLQWLWRSQQQIKWLPRLLPLQLLPGRVVGPLPPAAVLAAPTAVPPLVRLLQVQVQGAAVVVFLGLRSGVLLPFLRVQEDLQASGVWAGAPPALALALAWLWAHRPPLVAVAAAARVAKVAMVASAATTAAGPPVQVQAQGPLLEQHSDVVAAAAVVTAETAPVMPPQAHQPH